MTETIIRPVRPTDKSAVITLGRELIKAGDTYAFDSQMTDEDLWHYWTVEKQAMAYVAEQDTDILGIFVIKQNQPGPAAHIANASGRPGFSAMRHSDMAPASFRRAET